MIRCLLLDLDGVVRHFDPAITTEIETRFELEAGAIARAAFADPVLARLTTGELSRADWIAHIGREIGSADSAREWGAQPTRIDEDVLGIVSRSQIPAAILTNGTDTIRDELGAHGIAGFFEHVFNSAEIGVAKPDPRVYEHVLDALSLAPGEVFFADDSPANVGAARSAGIIAHHFTTATTLERELTRILGT